MLRENLKERKHHIKFFFSFKETFILLETSFDGASFSQRHLASTGQQNWPQALVFYSLFVILETFVALNTIKWQKLVCWNTCVTLGLSLSLLSQKCHPLCKILPCWLVEAKFLATAPVVAAGSSYC